MATQPCTTGSSGEYFFYEPLFGFNFFRCSFLLDNQTRQAFFWLFQVALVALYYGFFSYARRSVRVAITDGDDDMIAAMAAAFNVFDKHSCSIWGTERCPVLLRRCYFHLFSLNFNAHYKSFKYSDGGIGKQVRDALTYAARHAETEDEYLYAAGETRNFVKHHDVTGQFTSAAQYQLLAWLDARMCDYKQFARFVVYAVVDDMETTTNVAESAHHRLKSDPAVNNQSELRILVRSDTKAVSQLYNEIDRGHQTRMLEASKSQIPIEIVARTHLVKHAADAVLSAFADSKNYRVSACLNGEGCAMVWRVFAEDSTSKLPFRFNRGPRVLKESHGFINCPCPNFVSTQLVCAHIIAYNVGNFGIEDVHQRHRKKYYVDGLPDCSSFQGCMKRRPPNAAFEPLPARPAEGEKDTDNGNHDNDEQPPASAPRGQRSHMYSLLNQKARELVEKWSSIPMVATHLLNHLNSFDEEWGNPETYRAAGAPSSRPTQSRGSY